MNTENNNNKGNRQSEWFATGAFATIALCAITSDVLDGVDLSDTPKHVKWSTIAICIALSLSGLAFFAHFAKDKFVNTQIEGGMALLTCGILASALPAIMDPAHGLAMVRTGGIFGVDAIANANLYYFVWFAFFASFTVLIKFMHMKSEQVQKLGRSFYVWGGLMAASFIVMATSIRVFKQAECKDNDTDFCKRVSLAMSLGVISGFFAMAFMGLHQKLPDMVNMVMSGVLLAAWTIGIIFITFGDDRIARSIGNLYYFTWGSWIFSAVLVGESGKDMVAFFNKTEETTEEKKDDEKKDEAPADEEAANE